MKFSTVLATILLMFCTLNCFAEIYEYTDSNGTIHFTDDLSKVPNSLRKTAKKASESSLTVKESRMLDVFNNGKRFDEDVKNLDQLKKNLNAYADYSQSELGSPDDPVDPRLSTPEGALRLFKQGLETGNIEEIKAAVIPKYFESMDGFKTFTKQQLKSLSTAVPEKFITKMFIENKSATIEFRGFKVQVVKPFDNWRLVRL
jgi:hypothetical protein